MAAKTARSDSSTESSETTPETELAKFFVRNGYIRVPDEDRLEEGYEKYKKGHEVRLICDTYRETGTIRRLLRKVGLKGGKPFRKHSKWVQPIYGKAATDRFNEWLEEFEQSDAVANSQENDANLQKNDANSQKKAKR